MVNNLHIDSHCYLQYHNHYLYEKNLYSLSQTRTFFAFQWLQFWCRHSSRHLVPAAWPHNHFFQTHVTVNRRSMLSIDFVLSRHCISRHAKQISLFRSAKWAVWCWERQANAVTRSSALRAVTSIENRSRRYELRYIAYF